MTKTLKLIEAVKEGMTEKKASNIVKINFNETQSSITDYFIICDAETDKQVIAIADSVERTVRKKTGEHPFRKEGYENAEWIILDYFEAVIHIFQKKTREQYKLEELWADAETEKIEVKYSSIEN